ncbi:MAG: Crp/Fnr family transcriptional regulator [Burkholderiales bacterium]|nr:Crp/Fnr family transcriptional regulator [Burkholderiales bacterium]
MKLETDTSKLLAVDPWFSKLPPNLQYKLLAMAVKKQLPAGQSIVHRGQANSGMYCLVEGVVLAMSELEPGNEGVMAHFAPPAWFGEIGLVDGGPYTHTMKTDSPSTVMFFPRAHLLSLLNEDPSFLQHLALLLTAKLRISFFVLDELVKPPTEQRVARRLLIQAAGLGLRQAYQSHIDIHQEQLAQTLGMGRSTLNPILRRWSDAKWIQLTYGRITILNLDELKALAGYETWPEVYKDALNTPLPTITRG